jgi:CheY-like chemotaxis protein
LEGKGRRLARKILLADDSVTAQNMGRKILADAGYDVVTVNNGSAALKRINEINPDLIVLDVYMPGYSGLEVCQRLKESADTAHIPVLLTVGKLEPFKPEEARRVRADAHIVKPFEASELLTAITKLEDRMVPQPSEGSRVSSTSSGVERFNSAPSSRKSARVPETDTGWKNRIRFPSKKKKEEEPDPEDVAAAAGATFQDSKQGKKAAGNGLYGKVSAERAPAVVPDIPRDITPEELDALSALAEKLDAPQPAVTSEKVAAQAPATTEPSQPQATPLEVIPPTNEFDAGAQPAPKETESPQDPRAVAMSAESVAAKSEEVAPAITAENNFEARAVEQQETAQIEAAAEMETSQVREPEPASAAVNAELAAVPDAFVHGEDEQTSPPPVGIEPPAANRAEPFEIVSAGAATELETNQVQTNQVDTNQVETNQAEHTAVNVPVEHHPSEASAESVAPTSEEVQGADDSAQPSDAELAAALQLLTPATGATESSPSNGTGVRSHPSEHLDEVAPSGPRWVAETVALSAEESAISLEAEMFGTSFAAGTSAAMSTTSVNEVANPVASAVAGGSTERGIGFSGIAAAVETRLAEAGLGASGSTWASERERSAENAAAEAASALEASLELLAATSAATPPTTHASQAVDDVERRMASERSEAGRSESQEDAAEEKSERENSATFADAISGDGNKNERDSIAGRNGEVNQPHAEVNATTEPIGASMEVEDQNSMNKNGKTKSGKSNSHEIGTATHASADPAAAAPQNGSAVEDSQKAMAAAASEGSSTSTDASTIASIVDSVMADLRPRIVEEIARKLAKK